MKVINLIIIFAFFSIALPQNRNDREVKLTGGMGIDFSYVPMLVDYINNNYGYGKFLNTFNSGVEFWVDGSYNYSEKVDLDFEYTYNYFSYSNLIGIGANYELDKQANIFSALLLYKIPISLILFRIGGGASFEFVNIKEKIFNFNQGSAIGYGVVGKLELLTPFSDNVYANLSAVGRLNLVSSPNSENFSFYDNLTSEEVELNYFSVIVRIGITYIF